MNTPFDKTFDELLNGILTDYHNQFPDLDTSVGTLVFIKSSCLTSMLWGAYRHQGYIADQIFPDTANTVNLEHHAALRDILRTSAELDASLLARLQDMERSPPAGGNQYDYIKWALSIDDVAAAWCFPTARGDGTVDVVIMANATTTGSEIPTDALRTTVKTFIDSVRPVGPGTTSVQVIAPTATPTAVTIVGTGLNWDPVSAAANINSYMLGLVPDQKLFLSQLLSICVANGADNAVISAPSGDITPASHHMVRPGVINVT